MTLPKAQQKKRIQSICKGQIIRLALDLGNIETVLTNKLISRLSRRVQSQGSEMVAFADKSEFFAVLAELLPVHYFEKAPVVRIVWELWIAIRSTLTATVRTQMSHSMSSMSEGSGNSMIESQLLKEISIEFN